LRVGRRDDGKKAEAAGIVPHQLGAVFVELAGKAARFLDVVAVPDPRLGDREDRGRDAALVHLLERGRGRPFRRRRPRAPSRRHHGIDVKLRNEVMMYVDPRLGGNDLRVCGRDAADRGDRPQAQSGRAGGQKRSPRGARAKRLTAPARAEKSSSGIGGHFFPRDRCAASLALAPALFQARDSGRTRRSLAAPTESPMNAATSRPRLQRKSDSRGRRQSIRLATRRRGTLGVSKPLRSRIFLTPGV
jgi:hypothetical protein